MSILNDRVIESKNALMTALGDNAQKYLTSMKFWFRHKWTKEEFDLEARKLLTPETMHLHNKFLIAILNKIDTFVVPQPAIPITETNTNGTRNITSSSRKRKRSSKLIGDRSTFEPFDLYEYLMEDTVDIIRPPNITEDSAAATPAEIPQQRYCAQELFLPDAGFMMGRFLVGAWENGLINVDDSVAKYVAVAVQILLKNIITAILLKRKHYAVTGEGTFFYDVGRSVKDPFLRNTISRQKLVDTPLELDKEITSVSVIVKRPPNDDSIFLSACEEVCPKNRKPITVKDVYKALQDRNIIQSHSVYSINMERISQMLH